jgi:hypothetical protein
MRLPTSRRKLALLAIGLVISILVPVIAFRGVKLGATWDVVTQSDWPYLGLASAFFLFTLLVRAARWRIMLAMQRPVGFRPCLAATCVSFLANNVLPFRLSDLVRVGVIRQLAGVSAARSLGTVAVERVLDILTLVVFLGIYLLLGARGEKRGELLTWGGLALAGGFALIAVLIVGYHRRAWFAGLASTVVGVASPRLGKRIGGMVERVLEGFQVFSSPAQTASLFALSATLWGCAVIQYYWVGRALGLDVGLAEYVVVLFTTAIGAIIPAAPGALGTFESFAWAGLYLVGVGSKEQGLAFGAVLHLVEWVLMNVTGAYFLIVDHLSLVGAAARGEADAAPNVAGAESEPAGDAQPV